MFIIIIVLKIITIIFIAFNIIWYLENPIIKSGKYKLRINILIDKYY